VSRRGGGRGSSLRRGSSGGAAAYSPSSDPLSLIWWDPRSVSPGAVASWVDRIADVNASQGTGANQPTASATAISSAFPGVTSDGNDLLVAAGAGAILSGRTTLTVVAAMVDATTGTQLAWEYTASATANAGGFYLSVNEAAGNLRALVRPNVGFTSRQQIETLAAVKVVSVAYDFAASGANNVPFIRVNGVPLAISTVSAAGTPGSAANASLHLFARSGVAVPWAGAFGDFVVRNSVSQDAALDSLERYIGARVGLSW